MISEAGGAERSGPYNSLRGDKVIEFSKTFLDESVSLSTGSYKDVTGFKIQEGKLEVSMSDQSSNTLSDDSKYVGYCGDADNPSSILLKNNNLHIEIQIDHEDSIGKDETLLEISTDKVDSEIPCPTAGKVLELLFDNIMNIIRD